MSSYPDPSRSDPQPPPSTTGASDSFSAPPPPPGAPPGPGPGYQYAPPPPGAAAGPPRDALAGFWIRFVAALVDGFLLGIVAALIGVVFGLGTGAATDFGRQDTALALFAGTTNVVGIILGGAYFTYLHGTPAGQTIGNRLVGIRVVDEANGASLPYARSFIRFLMSYVSRWVIYLGYLWMLWDPQKQTWHDKVASSLVVKASAYPPPAPFGRPAA